MTASAFASALLRGGSSDSPNGVRHTARNAAASLLPLDCLTSTLRLSPAKLRRRWDVAHRLCDIMLVVLGLWLAATSFLNLRGPAATQGTFLGLSITALGCVGLWASGRECLSLRTLMLVGLGCSGLSTLQFMQQITRDVTTHCALAEAATRIHHLEERLEKTRHDELITQLFFRMNEMDDLLSLMQQSAAATAAAHSAVWRAAQADRDYLRAKVGALRRHAAAVGEALKAKIAERKANASAAAAGGGGEGTPDLGESLWGVERRLEAVDSVCRYLDQKEAGGDLTYEEYEIILEALLEGSAGHVPATTMTVLRNEKSGLDAIKAAYERHKSQSYHHVLTDGGRGETTSIGALTHAEARKESSRKHFENRFMGLFQAHGSHHGAAFRASLNAALAELPEHCVRDVDAYAALSGLGWALLGAQAVAGYAALTAFVWVAKKDD